MIKFRSRIADYRQKLEKIFFYFIGVLSCILSVSSHEIAFAAEEAGHSFNFKDLFWPIINFAILVIILVKFLAKPAKEYFKKRTELIEKSIQEAEAAQEIAQKTLAEVKERLKNIDHDINEILNAAQKAGKNEKEALVAEGEHLKNKILEQAKAQIEFELQKAKDTIKSEAALLALELAEKQIKESLGKKEQATLIDEYIKKLEVKK